MRKVLIVLIGLLVVIGGVYFFYIRPRMSSGEPLPAIVTTFFPKITSNGISFGTDTQTPTPEDTAAQASKAALKQLTGRAIAGYTVFPISTTVSIPSITDPKAKPTVQTIVDHYVRYVGRNNGYIYELKNNETPLQISNVFIPNIYEAYFADSNKTALLRFLRQDNQTIATYSVPIPDQNADGTRTQIPGTYLPDNIYSLAVSPDQSRIARITTDANGGLVTSSTSKGTIVKTIFRSAFQSWLPQWNTKSIYLQSKASGSADGYVYSIDESLGRLRRIVGNVKGLTTNVSPSGTYIIYSESAGNGFATSIFTTATNAIAPLSMKILPEKCTWLKNEDLICAGSSTVPEAIYPDAWYAGTIHLSDQLYGINPRSNTYTTLYDGNNGSFDMTNLQTDEDQRFVYFIDKGTGFLYRYQY